jgi:YkoY family integral membrane protein
LTYGLFGALVFRTIMIALATFLLQWRVVKLLGGGYLLWISLQHFFFKKDEPKPSQDDDDDTAPAEKLPGFWTTVALIEVTDVAFAVDSILAAIALVGNPPAGHVGTHPKLWVVMTGGMIGVMLMRVASAMFIRLLERFPRFETSAYLLVLTIGSKLLVDWAMNSAQAPDRADFHNSSSPLFWAFWSVMAICLAIGFPGQEDGIDAGPAGRRPCGATLKTSRIQHRSLRSRLGSSASEGGGLVFTSGEAARRFLFPSIEQRGRAFPPIFRRLC